MSQCVSCLTLLAASAAAWGFHRSQRAASASLTLNVRSVRAAEELAIGVRDLRAHLERFLAAGDAARLAPVGRLRGEMDRWLAEAWAAAVAPQEFEMMARVSDSYGRLLGGVGRLDALPPADRPAAARALVALAGEVLVPAQEYLDYNEAEFEANSAASERTAAWMAVGLLLLGVCGPVSGIVAGWAVTRAVGRSVVRLSVPVVDAAGKLSQVVGPVVLSASPGLDELEEALHRVARQAGEVVERLRRSQAEALRAERLAALGQMAAGFAHEVRNPLMSMKLLAQSAAARRAGLSGRDLSVMEEEIGRLEALTASFLDFARPPAPHKEVIDAREAVEEAVELVASRAWQRDVQVGCDLLPGPAWVEADAGQVRQVLLNLLLNAVEAAPDGGEVLARLSAGRAAWVEVVVEDDGPGLPDLPGQDIFEPFVSTKPTGLGLGLSVCKRIAEAHGGEVAASNRPGGGAAFTLRLPTPLVPATSPARTA